MVEQSVRLIIDSIKSFSHVMSNVHESSWFSLSYLLETINQFTHGLVNLVSKSFEVVTFNSTVFVVDDELHQGLSDFFHEIVAWLAFNDFQLQLLKIFLFTLVSIVALIFIAWHIYGPRISEQFMEQNTLPEDCDSTSGE